jgi:hypothetical protein
VSGASEIDAGNAGSLGELDERLIRRPLLW